MKSNQRNKQAISTGHEITLEAAETVLNEGGNAFDAAFAAGFTMFLTEPCMASAGAGGFAMCLKHGYDIQLLDFFTQTPLNKEIKDEPDFYPIQVNFGNELETFHVGRGSAATPGMVAGLFTMHNALGSIPVSELMQIPMKYAQQGVQVNKFQEIDLGLLETIFRIDPSVKDIFFNKGKSRKEGEHFHMPHLSDFLQLLVDEGARGFYKGEISAKIDRDFKNKGGYLRRADFENYQAIWRKPLQYPMNNHIVQAPPGPSLGGAVMLLLLESIRNHDGHWLPAIAEVKSNYKGPGAIIQAFSLQFPDQKFKVQHNMMSTKGTSHFNILDKYGNAIALTCSIGEGCGYFIPGTDMQMNNMMGEDFLLPDGFHSWKENVRLNSKMTPTIITDKTGEFTFSGGSGGAGRIPYVMAEVIWNLLVEDMSLEEAVLSPRLVLHEKQIHFEHLYDREKLYLDGYTSSCWDDLSLFFGGVHAISMDSRKKVSAIGDPRRYGRSSA